MVVPLLASFIDLNESLCGIHFEYRTLALFRLLLNVDLLSNKGRIILHGALRYYSLSVLAGGVANEAPDVFVVSLKARPEHPDRVRLFQLYGARCDRSPKYWRSVRIAECRSW